jgi:hypothetical protein
LRQKPKNVDKLILNVFRRLPMLWKVFIFVFFKGDQQDLLKM